MMPSESMTCYGQLAPSHASDSLLDRALSITVKKMMRQASGKVMGRDDAWGLNGFICGRLFLPEVQLPSLDSLRGTIHSFNLRDYDRYQRRSLAQLGFLNPSNGSYECIARASMPTITQWPHWPSWECEIYRKQTRCHHARRRNS